MGWFSTAANGDGLNLSHQTDPVLPPVSQSGRAVGHHCSSERPASSYLHAEPAHSILEAEDSWPQQPSLLLGTQTPHWRGPVVTGAIHQLWVFISEWEITACHCFCYINHCKRRSGTRPPLPLTPSLSVEVNPSSTTAAWIFFPIHVSSPNHECPGPLPKLPGERGDPSLPLAKHRPRL